MDPDRDDENAIGPDLTALERRLSAWRPSTGALDRDRMLYDAGRDAAGARPWRLMAASLLLSTLGLASLLAYQHSSIARERALLAQERAHRRQLELAPAAPNGLPPSTPAPQEPIEPPGPSSYLVLTARLAEGWDVAAPADVASEPAPHRPTPDPSEAEWHPAPLRQQDIRRVLDL